jgi:hypothetical protein
MFNFFFESRAFYEVTWKNVVHRCKPKMTIWRMRNACWISKAKIIRTVCVSLIAFPLQQWLHEGASMLRYAYFACLVILNMCNMLIINLYYILGYKLN